MSALKLDSLPKWLRVSYIFALSTVACLAGLAWLAQHTLIEHQADNALLVNISGRQRMLAQRIALFAHLLVTSKEGEDTQRAQQQLESAISEFEEAHHAILNGNSALNLKGDITPETRAYYTQSLDHKVERYIELAHTLKNTPTEELKPDNPALIELMELGPHRLVQGLHRAALLHQRSAEADVRDLNTLQVLILLTTLLVLAAQARWIFHPLINQLKGALSALVQQETLTDALHDAQLAKSQLTEAIDAVPVGFVAWDNESKLIICNDLYRAMHPRLAPHLSIGTPIEEVFRQAYLEREPGEGGGDLDQRIERETREYLAEIHGEERLNGIDSWCLVHRRLTESGRRVSTWTDINQRKAFETQMTLLAWTDTLTGLGNREQFLRELNKAINAGRASGDHFALMILDLSRFKAVNDTWGHPVGDKLLKQVTQRLKATLQDHDIIARLGGDEFAILTRGATSPAATTPVAKRIIEELCTPFLIEGRTLTIGASVGIAYFPESDTQAHELIRMANVALHMAKSRGGNLWQNWESEMDRSAVEQSRLSLEIVGAIRDHQLIPFYQPILNRDGEVEYFEALLRWQHPELGLLTPDRFLPAFQSRPEMNQVGRHVIKEACSAMARWRRAGVTPQCVAVNMTAGEFADPDLIDYIIDELRQRKLPHSALKLELTEATILNLNQEMIDKMRQLKLLGVDVALDDFGTGYSSLRWLHHLPIKSLKIDRSFVAGLPSDRGSMAIIEAMLVLCERMGLTVVAEGVETLEQRDYLLNAGCHSLQGWLYEKALPEGELIDWLQNTHNKAKVMRETKKSA